MRRLQKNQQTTTGGHQSRWWKRMHITHTTPNKEAIFGFMQSCCSCLSCRISCSTAPGITCMSSACHLHVICALSACHLHVICMLSAHCLHVICACAYVVRTRTCHLHIVCRPSAPLLMVTVGLNYLLL